MESSESSKRDAAAVAAWAAVTRGRFTCILCGVEQPTDEEHLGGAAGPEGYVPASIICRRCIDRMRQETAWKHKHVAALDQLRTLAVAELAREVGWMRHDTPRHRALHALLMREKARAWGAAGSPR